MQITLVRLVPITQHVSEEGARKEAKCWLDVLARSKEDTDDWLLRTRMQPWCHSGRRAAMGCVYSATCSWVKSTRGGDRRVAAMFFLFSNPFFVFLLWNSECILLLLCVCLCASA